MVEPALTAGFIGAGMDVTLVGPLPTPAIAMLTRSLRADLGVMISASHNPFEDNGIKLFGPDGFKLSDETEAQIEALMDRISRSALPRRRSLGGPRGWRMRPAGISRRRKPRFPRGLRLDDLKIVIDCAHGAAYRVAPTVLWELGANVIRSASRRMVSISTRDAARPCPIILCAQVVRARRRSGLALDGDADRLLICRRAWRR